MSAAPALPKKEADRGLRGLTDFTEKPSEIPGQSARIPREPWFAFPFGAKRTACFSQKRKRKPRIEPIRADHTDFLRVPSVKSVNPRNPWSAFRF
ncbi:MAG: hypothetical protein ACRERC_04400, partial [Candidatus Binatia bacterium]